MSFSVFICVRFNYAGVGVAGVVVVALRALMAPEILFPAASMPTPARNAMM